MDKTEILNIVNEPSKHIQIVNLDGEASIAYSAKFVELLELIPTMLTKADMVAMLEEISLEIDEMDCTIDHDFEGYYTGRVDCQKLIRKKINSLKEQEDEKA